MASLRVLLSIIFIYILFSSCDKHESVLFQSHSIQTPDEITSVCFWDNKNGVAVGGHMWSRAIICRTIDGGKNWKIDSVYDKEIFCSTHKPNELLIAMGIELNIYELHKQETIIRNIKQRGNFRFIRGLSVYDSNTIMAVHGLGYGSIEKFGLHSDSSNTVLIVNHELYAIQCIDHLNWIACGYGIVLHSNDTGEHWDTLDVFGDDFTDISFLAPSTVYILGSAGTVLKSDDSGLHFTILKSGGIIDNSTRFKCICFKNIQEGIIAGNNGLVMLTRDGGLSWSVLDGLPTFDIKDIYHDGERYWLCGSSGMIISFAI